MGTPFRVLLTTTIHSSNSGMSALTRDLIQMSKEGSLSSRLKCHSTIFSLACISARKYYNLPIILAEHSNLRQPESWPVLSMQVPPVLPRNRKAPSQLEVGSGDGFHSTTVEERYCRQYFEALDLAISGIRKRFDQPGYAVYKSLEGLLVTAANQQCFQAYFQQVTSFYKDDFKPVELEAQLLNLGTWFSRKKQEAVSLQDCLQYHRSLSDGQRSFYSEVCCLACLILVMPSTNAVSERNFSAMRRLKTCLRSTMHQTRLNHVLLRNMHKERLDSLDLDIIANDFVRGK